MNVIAGAVAVPHAPNVLLAAAAAVLSVSTPRRQTGKLARRAAAAYPGPPE